jgi:hypothetical protein
MPTRPNEAARNAILTEGLDHFDGAVATLYEGPQPDAGGGSAGASTPIASGTLPTPAFAAASGGGRGPASNWTLEGAVGVTDEEAGWLRVEQTGGATIDFEVSDTAPASLVLDSTTVNEGDLVRVVGGSVFLPDNDATS